MTLKRDINFISSMMQGSNIVKRKLDIVEKNVQKQKELSRFKLLGLNAKIRGVRLSLSPKIFERHRKNISFYFAKGKALYWNIELILVSKKAEREWNLLAFLSDPLNEQTTISDLLTLLPFGSPEIQNFFQGSVDAPTIVSLLSAEKYKLVINPNPSAKSAESQVLQLKDVDVSKSIQETLKETHVIDFPTIYIVSTGQVEDFQKTFAHSKKHTFSLNDCFN